MPNITAMVDSAPVHTGTLRVHLAGCVDFDAMQGLQDYEVYQLSGQSDCSGVLFLCEHPPIITMGRDASRTNITVDDDVLSKLGLETRWVARGGGAMVHGPAQLAIYLLVPLHKLGLTAAAFRRKLETAIVNSCQSVKIPAIRRSDSVGVWTRGGQLGYFGAGVKSQITTFGAYLNVSISPDLLKLVQPFGEDSRATTIQNTRLEPVREAQIRELLIHHICQQFGYHQTDIATGHPLLGRTTSRVLIHA